MPPKRKLKLVEPGPPRTPKKPKSGMTSVGWVTTPTSRYIKVKEAVGSQPVGIGTKIAGVASGATLGFITANVPGMVIGGSLGLAAAEGASVLQLGESLVEKTTGIPISGIKSIMGKVTGNSSPNNMATQSTSVSRRSGTRSSYSSRLSSRFGRAYRARFGRRKRGFRYRTKKKSGVKKKRMNKKKMKGKKKKSAKKEKYLANTHGIVRKRETYGKVSSDHAVYLKHGTFNDIEFGSTICGALIRKLFMKAGLDINHHNDIITVRGSSFVSGDLRLLFTYSSDGVPSTVTNKYINVSNTGPMYAISFLESGFADMRNFFIDYIREAEHAKPMWLDLQYHEVNEDIYITHTRLDLQSLKIHYHVSSVLKVQNRTLPPASADSHNLTDTVDNQPLSGKLYHFKNSDPKLAAGVQHMLAGNGDAVLAGVTGEGFEGFWGEGDTYEFLDPPPKHYWKNVGKVVPALIQVGESQQTGCSYAISCGFQQFLDKFRNEWDDMGRYHNLPGKSQILGLTEFIHTPNTNKITVGYERHLTIGIWFTNMKKTITFNPTFSTVASPIDFVGP